MSKCVLRTAWTIYYIMDTVTIIGEAAKLVIYLNTHLLLNGTAVWVVTEYVLVVFDVILAQYYILDYPEKNKMCLWNTYAPDRG